MAVDRDTSKSRFKLDYPFVQPHYMKKELLTFGVTTADYGDCTMQIFDRDRLICECIFYENKMDRETYNKAIQGYVADAKKSVPRLLEYAEKRRILKKVKDRIGDCTAEKQSKRNRQTIPAAFTAVLPGRVSAPAGGIPLCSESSAERRFVHLYPDKL